MTRRLVSLLLVLTAAAAFPGCDAGDAETLADDARRRATEVEQRARDARTQAERVRDRLRRRVQETLDRLERAVPKAPPDATGPRQGEAPMEAFLTEVLTSVDEYWTTTFRASGFREPRVSYLWIDPGDRVRTGCNNIADDDAALYCPSDDTIYAAEEFAQSVLDGIRDDFPGTRAGEGRAVGDFGVAYIVAHEYAHNLQDELGFFSSGRRLAVKQFELQADCMAGSWGASVYRQGKLQPGDVEEALGTAKAVGDFEYLDPQHHGTPDERRDAWLRGFESGDPSVCRDFVPQ